MELTPKPEDFKDQLLLGTIKHSYSIREGQRWGLLECILIEHTTAVWKINGCIQTQEVLLKLLRCAGRSRGNTQCKGDFYVMEGYDPPKNIMDKFYGVHPHKFPGRKVMRDCGCMGRGWEELPIDDDIREELMRSTRSVEGVKISAAVPVLLYARLSELAVEEGSKTVDKVRECIVRGLVETDKGETVPDRWLFGRQPRQLQHFRVGLALHKRIEAYRRKLGREKHRPVGISTALMQLVSIGLESIERTRKHCVVCERDARRINVPCGFWSDNEQINGLCSVVLCSEGCRSKHIHEKHQGE